MTCNYESVRSIIKIGDLLASNHIFQITLQVAFWQYRVTLFPIILGEFIEMQFGQKMNRMRPVIPDCIGIGRG